MKLLKKAFISVLAVALCTSLLAFNAFALETEQVTDVLAYYESPEYLMEDFSDSETAILPSYNADFEEVSARVEDGVLKVVTSEIQGNATAVRYNVAVDSQEVGFGVNLDLKTIDGVLTIRLQGQGQTEQALHLLFVDFAKGVVVYRGFDGVQKDYVDITVEGLNPLDDEWTSVQFFYNSTDKAFSFKVGPKDGELTSVADISFPLLDSISNIIFGFEVNDYDQSGEAENVGITAQVDNVEVYSGQSMYTAAQKQAIVTEKVQNLAVAYETADDATKALIVNVIDELVNVHGYSTDDSVAGGFIATLLPGISVTYLESYLEAVNAIDQEKNYKERLAQLEIIGAAKANIRSEDSFTAEQADAYAEAIVVHENEISEVNAIAAACESFMASLKSEGEYISVDELNYAQLISYASVADGYEYDISYDGVSDAVTVYEATKAKLSAIKENTVKYYNSVCVLANDAGDKTLGERYLAYLDATERVGNVDFSYTDDEITTELLGACPTKYVSGYDEIDELVLKCQEFMTYIDQSSLVASYYTKEGFILEAKALLDTFTDGVEETYPGMDSYLADYNSTVEYLETSMTNKNLYVNAVNELAELWNTLSYSERVEKVNAALALKDAGTVPGLSIIEENTKLDNYKTIVDTLKMHSENLINIVNVQLKKSGITLLERRQLIAQAQIAAANSEPTYKGVSSAKTALQNAIALYNSDVTAANNAYNNNLNVAVTATGGVSLSTVVLAIVNVLKKLLAFIFG